MKLLFALCPLSGATDFSSYRELINRKLAGELRMAVEIVDRIAMTPRGKRKFINQRLDLKHALANLQQGRAPSAHPATAPAL